MKARMKDMVRVATARLGGEQQAGAASSSTSGFGRRGSMAVRTARLGGDSLRRHPQPQAPTVRTVYCNDREANAPVGYKVRLSCSPFASIASFCGLDPVCINYKRVPSSPDLAGIELDRLLNR
jgi:phospholipid-transporting ATPase